MLILRGKRALINVFKKSLTYVLICWYVTDKVHFNKEEGRPFTIADYGSADGAVSMSLFAKFIGK